MPKNLHIPPIWLLVLLILSGTLGMHIFAPVLNDVGRSFSTAPAVTQTAVSFYILGLAVGQPIYGPLSDSFGRRPILLLGLSLYTLGGLCSCLAPNIETLAMARFLQALGGCAGLLLGRAIVRDTAAEVQSMRRLGLLNMAMMAGPGLAPIVGLAISAAWGWRYILLLMTCLGLVNLYLVWQRLPETGKPTGQLHPMQKAKDYLRFLKSLTFMSYAVGGGFITASTYAFFATASFIVVDQLQRPVHQIGVAQGIIILGAAVGSALVGRLLKRIKAERLLGWTIVLATLFSFILCLSIWFDFFSFALMLFCLTTFTFVSGICSPIAMTKAMSWNEALIGSAAGLYGAVQMLVGVVCTSLAGIGSNHLQTMATVLLGSALMSQMAFYLAQKNIG